MPSFRSLLLTAGLTLAAACCGTAHAGRPAWWLQALNSNPAQDSAAATQGQAMQMAVKARDRMTAEFPLSSGNPYGPGAAIENLISGYSAANNGKALKIGQLKALSAPFWDRLAALKVLGFPKSTTQPYPWTQTTSDDADNAMATLGQVKAAFEFEIDGEMRDTNSNLLPDSWELTYRPALAVNSTDPNALHGSDNPTADFDQDGLTDLEEYQRGADPTQQDTDGDGLRDGLEKNIGTSPTLKSNGLDTDMDGITDAAEGLIRYLAQLRAGTYGGGSVPGSLAALAAVDPANNSVDPDGVSSDFKKIWYLVAPGAADADADADGLVNRDEAFHRTWPAPLFAQLSAGDRAALLSDLNGDGIPELLQPVLDFAPAGYNDTVPADRADRCMNFDGDALGDGAEVAIGRNPRVADASFGPDIIPPLVNAGDPVDKQSRDIVGMGSMWSTGQWMRALQNPYGTTPANAFLYGDPARIDIRFSRGIFFRYRDKDLAGASPRNDIPTLSMSTRTRDVTYASADNTSATTPGSWTEITPDNLALGTAFPSSSNSVELFSLNGQGEHTYSSTVSWVKMEGKFTPNLSLLLRSSRSTSETAGEIAENVPDHPLFQSNGSETFIRFDTQGSDQFQIPSGVAAAGNYSIGKFDDSGSTSGGTYLDGRRSAGSSSTDASLMYIGEDNPLNDNKITKQQIVREQLVGVPVPAGSGSSRIVTLRCRFYPGNNAEGDPYVQGIGFTTRNGDVELFKATGDVSLPENRIKENQWITPSAAETTAGFLRLRARLDSNSGLVSFKLKMRGTTFTVFQYDEESEEQTGGGHTELFIDGPEVKLVSYAGETSTPSPRMGVQIAEDAGSRFRKIGINGVPMSDSKPQSEDETDQNNGETHVDALTHSLYHHTSDLYVPIAASDLSLSAERTLRQEVTTDGSQGGGPNLLSGDGTGYIGKPFGICWASGLTPNIELSLAGATGGGSMQDRATVVDESGGGYSFALGSVAISGGRTPLFVPLASGPDQTAYMNRLEVTDAGSGLTDYANWKLTLHKRFGTQTRYEYVGTLVDMDLQDNKPQIRRTRHYFRTVSQGALVTETDPLRWAVSDRYGNKLYYHYTGNGGSGAAAIAIQKALIPWTISDFANLGTTGARYLRITGATSAQLAGVASNGFTAANADNYFAGAFIGQIDVMRQGSATPAQRVTYDYAVRKLPAQGSRFPDGYHILQLGRVRKAIDTQNSGAGEITDYFSYADAQEPDSGAPSPETGPATYRHLWMSRMVRGDGRYLRFNTAFDRSRVRYCAVPGTANAFNIYYEQGKPRPVTGILAGQYNTGFAVSTGNGEGYLSVSAQAGDETVLSRFALQSDGKNALDPLVLDNALGAANPTGKLKVVNPPVNAVVDGDNRLRLYRFSDPDIREGTDLVQILFPPPAGQQRDTIVSLAWKKLEIDHGLGAREIYTFEPDAMMALSKATMIVPGQAGLNPETTWTYTKAYSIAHPFPWLKDATYTVNGNPTGIYVKDHPFFPKYYPDPSSESRTVMMPAGAAGTITGLAQEVGNNSTIVKQFTYWVDTQTVDAQFSQHRVPWARTMVRTITTGPGFSHKFEMSLDAAGRPQTEIDYSGAATVRTVNRTYETGTTRPLLKKESIVNGVAVGTPLETSYEGLDIYGQYSDTKKGSGTGLVVGRAIRNELGQVIEQYTGTTILASSFVYRGDGRLQSETKPAVTGGLSSFPSTPAQDTAAVTTYTYDSAGRKATMRVPDGVLANDGTLTAYEYDLLGRLKRTIITPGPAPCAGATEGTDTTTEYSVTGLPVFTVSPAGLEVRTTYDWLRRCTLKVTHDSVFGAAGTRVAQDTAIAMDYAGSWCGDSLFDASSFKPTLIRGPFVSSNGPARIEAHYNSLGWKVSEKVQYNESQMVETRTAYDARGQIIGVQTPGGSDTINLLTKTPRDVLGRVTQTIQPDGGVSTPTILPSGLVTQVEELVPGVGGTEFTAQIRVSRTVYDAAGREIAVYPPAPGGSTFSATPSKLSHYDPAGTGRLLATAVPALQIPGNSAPTYYLVTWNTYDNRNRIYQTRRGIAITPSAAGAPAVFSGAGAYALKEYTAPAAGQTSGTTVNTQFLDSSTWYDRMDRPTRTLAPDGAETVTVYDYAGRPLRSVGPRTTTLGATGLQDATSTLSVGTVEGNICTSTIYDKGGRATMVRSGILLAAATGQTLWEKAVNAITHPAENLSVPGNSTVTNAYDANGRLLSTARELTAGTGDAVTETFEYDGAGNRILVKDGNGATSLFSYDPLGRLLTTAFRARAVGSTADKFDITRNTWYAAVLRMTKAPDGRIKTFTYDLGLRISTVTGSQDTGVYSGALQPVEPVQTSVHNAAGELLTTSVSGQSWRNTSCTYDARSRKTSEISAGRTQTYTYNELNQLVTTTSDLAGAEGDSDPTDDLKITTTYDLQGRVSTINDNRNNETTTYGYDRGGRLIMKNLPGGAVTEWKTYDLAGRVLTQRTISSAAGVPQQLTTCVQDSSGNVVFQAETRPVYGGVAAMSRYVWNTYDGLDRLASESIYAMPAAGSPVGGHMVPAEKADYTYDLANNRTQLVRTLANGSITTETCGYNVSNETAGSPFWYELGLAPEDIPALADGADPREPAYRRANQLCNLLIEQQTNAASPRTVTRAVAYRYDRNGNRSRSVEFAMASGQGRVTKDTVYTWDQSSRLVSAKVTGRTPNGTPSGALGSSQTWQYGYDHRSRRVMRGAPGTGNYEFDSFAGGTALNRWIAPTLATTPDTRTRVTSFIRGSDFGGGVGGLLYTLDATAGAAPSNSPRYAEYGLRGDITGIAGINGGTAVVPLFAASYRAFGDYQFSDPVSAGGSTIRHRASTKEEESQLGLLNEGFRYRDITTGVFLSRDPAGFVDGPNLYAYVGQNPWSKFDPEGLWGRGESNGPFLDGIWDGVGESVGGMVQSVSHPIDTAVAVKNAAVATYEGINEVVTAVQEGELSVSEVGEAWFDDTISIASDPYKATKIVASTAAGLGAGKALGVAGNIAAKTNTARSLAASAFLLTADVAPSLAKVTPIILRVSQSPSLIAAKNMAEKMAGVAHEIARKSMDKVGMPYRGAVGAMAKDGIVQFGASLGAGGKGVAGLMPEVRNLVLKFPGKFMGECAEGQMINGFWPRGAEFLRGAVSSVKSVMKSAVNSKGVANFMQACPSCAPLLNELGILDSARSFPKIRN